MNSPQPSLISMESLRGSPLLGVSHLDSLALTGMRSQWTWRQVHLAAIALAGQLHAGETVCNLCNSRVGFLVTWLAALRQGCLQLLPPSGGNADLTVILQSCLQPVIVVDDEQLLQPQWAPHARCFVNVPSATLRSLPDDGLSWQPDWDVPVARLYTSGSTGVPEPQTRTLGQLARGAQHVAERLKVEFGSGPMPVSGIVCSVPPQHMFGLELSVMLPLVHGVPVLESRPLLPADVVSAFEQMGEGTAWITTPLHLQALVRSGVSVPHCRMAVSSTMALDAATAGQSEALIDAPVFEIYGSTETGAVAMRRAAKSIRWQPLADVHIEAGVADAGTRIWGSHFPSPQTLTDHIQMDEDGCFELLGRHGDMVKIGGRRASLAGLNLLLSGMPGLEDGVFYLPSRAVAAARLVLIHDGAALDPVVVEQWLRERMDPVFLPRAIICTPSLGRSNAGKLSKVMLDSIYAGWRAKRGA